MAILPYAQLSADSIRRAADEAGSKRRRGARAARELTRFTLGQKSLARDAWEAALEVLKEGVTKAESREIIDIVLNISRDWLELAQKTHEVWHGVAEETGAMPEGLEAVTAAEKDVLEVKASAEKLLAFLTRERPLVDPERLRKGVEEAAAGNVKTVEELRSRFPKP